MLSTANVVSAVVRSYADSISSEMLRLPFLGGEGGGGDMNIRLKILVVKTKLLQSSFYDICSCVQQNKFFLNNYVKIIETIRSQLMTQLNTRCHLERKLVSSIYRDRIEFVI